MSKKKKSLAVLKVTIFLFFINNNCFKASLLMKYVEYKFLCYSKCYGHFRGVRHHCTHTHTNSIGPRLEWYFFFRPATTLTVDPIFVRRHYRCLHILFWRSSWPHKTVNSRRCLLLLLFFTLYFHRYTGISPNGRQPARCQYIRKEI